MKSSNRYRRIPDYKNKSLNSSFQKWETKKIEDENEALLRRLQMRKSNYSVIQWNKEHKSRKKMLTSMCEYPYQFSGTKAPLPKINNSSLNSYWKKLHCMNVIVTM